MHDRPVSMRRRWPFVLIAGVALTGLTLYMTGTWRGPAVVVLPPLPESAGVPVLSPDGRHLAFAHGTAGSNDLYVRSLRTGEDRRLVRGVDGRPAWSPDGARLAFVRSGPDCAFFSVSVAGGASQRLGACAGDVAWAPTRPLLALSVQPTPGGPSHLALFNLPDSTLSPLTTPLPGGDGDRYPAFSPDGSALAFVRTDAQGSDLYMIPTAGGPPRRLTTDRAPLDAPAWSPDGRRLYFASRRTGRFRLWTVPVGGGVPRPVETGLGEARHPSVAPQAGLLVFMRVEETITLYARSTEEAGERPPPAPLPFAGHRNEAPRHAPDGRLLACISDRSGTEELWQSAPDGTRPVRLTNFRGPVPAHPRWSPDGRWLAFEAPMGGNADLYVVAAGGGGLRRITSNPARDVRPAWSPDGRWLYFASDRSGDWQVWRKPVDGGAATQVTTSGAFRPFLSPDGRDLYYLHPGTSEIWRRPVAGGASLLVLDLLPAAQPDNWEVSRAGLHFVYYDALTGPHLATFDIETGLLTLRTALPLRPRNGSLTVAPDGRSFLFAHRDRHISRPVMWAEPP